ncbi:MAG TPA: thiolase family protein [Phycisphaerales bacterium]|nr:thiolase family protein [Phycisphaerales bacterium]
MTNSHPVILAAKRTPIGRFFGGLAKVHSPHLGAYAIQGIFAENPKLAEEAKAGRVDEVLMGCVLQAGLGQNPARQAALKGGCPDTQSALTINKVCGSGLQAVMSAAQSIKAGDNSLVLAGGFENMTGAPYFAKIRDSAGAPKFGPMQFEDHMQYDGLRCAFECWAMGNGADYIAKKYEVSRADQDAWSARSHQRAAEATKNGWFKNEIVALTGEQCNDKKSPGVSADEGIRAETTADGLAKLRPVFDAKEGTVTAGNASQISDGGAAVAVASMARAEQLGIKPIAKILAYHTSGVAPKDIFRAPALAVPAVIAKAGLKMSDIDLFELNEAFAAQVLQNMRDGGVPEEKVNVAGGAIALGHPIGGSGARCLVTLLHNLIRTGGKRGVVALCLGGGNAVAMVVER